MRRLGISGIKWLGRGKTGGWLRGGSGIHFEQKGAKVTEGGGEVWGCIGYRRGVRARTGFGLGSRGSAGLLMTPVGMR